MEPGHHVLQPPRPHLRPRGLFAGARKSACACLGWRSTPLGLLATVGAWTSRAGLLLGSHFSCCRGLISVAAGVSFQLLQG